MKPRADVPLALETDLIRLRAREARLVAKAAGRLRGRQLKGEPPAGSAPAGSRRRRGPQHRATRGRVRLPWFHRVPGGGTSAAGRVRELRGAVVPAVDESQQVRFL